MQAETHPLEPFFQQMVRNSYAGKLGINDTAITQYVAHLLCEFSEADKLYKVRDEEGRPIRSLDELVQAADPVHGTAPSFDAERAVRKHIGDYALFVSGMYPESMDPFRRRHGQQNAILINKPDLLPLAHKRHRLALLNCHANLIRQEAHHRCMLHPWNRLKLPAPIA